MATPSIGRERELAEIEKLLSARRLLTLKSRRIRHGFLVNRCRDILRRRSRSREVAIDGLGLAGDRDGQPTDLTALNAAFEQLSVAHRQLLVLHHLHHEPVAAIARQLGARLAPPSGACMPLDGPWSARWSRTHERPTAPERRADRAAVATARVGCRPRPAR